MTNTRVLHLHKNICTRTRTSDRLTQKSPHIQNEPLEWLVLTITCRFKTNILQQNCLLQQYQTSKEFRQNCRRSTSKPNNEYLWGIFGHIRVIQNTYSSLYVHVKFVLFVVYSLNSWWLDCLLSSTLWTMLIQIFVLENKIAARITPTFFFFMTFSWKSVLWVAWISFILIGHIFKELWVLNDSLSTLLSYFGLTFLPNSIFF